MTRSENIILPSAIMGAQSIAQWADRAELDFDTANSIWKNACWVVQEFVESDIPPVVALHVAQMIFMVSAASSKLERHTAIEFWNEFSEHAWTAAVHFAEGLPRDTDTPLGASVPVTYRRGPRGN